MPRPLPPAWPVREPPLVVLPANRLRRCPDCREPFRPETAQDRQCADCRRKVAAVVAPRRPRRTIISRRSLVASASMVVAASAMATWLATRGRLLQPTTNADAHIAPADLGIAAPAVADSFRSRLSTEPPPRSMHVESDPPGAAVWHAGEPLGYTPLELNLPLPRSTDPGLLLIKEGFQPLRLSLAAAPDGAALTGRLLALRAPQRTSPQYSEHDWTTDEVDAAASTARLQAESPAPVTDSDAGEVTAPNAEMVTWRTRRPSADTHSDRGAHEPPPTEQGSLDLQSPTRVDPAMESVGPLSAGQFVAIAVGRVADPADLAAVREHARQAVDRLRDDQSLCLLIESATGMIDVFGRFAPADALRRIRARDAIDTYASVAAESADGSPPLTDLQLFREADCVWLLCGEARHTRAWTRFLNDTPAGRSPRVFVECVHGERAATDTNLPVEP